MLEDIGSHKTFDTTIKNAKRITSFIYRHGRLHYAMTVKTGGRELVKPGATRFATSFLTLQSLYRFRDQLKQLFVSEDWCRSDLSKTDAGKIVYDLILPATLWNNIANCIKASQPLLVALRVVDADEKPAMPEIIAAMELAKTTITESFHNNATLRKFVIDIIDNRWDMQMGVQLYAAALFLNPSRFFEIQENDFRNACKLREDFNDVLEKMVPDREMRELISNQTDNYEHTMENFARQMAIDQRKTKSPLDWWSAYGGRAIDLAMVAKRIVGLCCSSSGCERNWSTFEFIHTKRRNRLEHKRLNDLVYIQYNEKIAERFQKRRELGKNFDPIALEDFNWSGEWVGNPDDDVVHPGEDLTWEQVVIASGPASAVRNLRSRNRDQGETRTYSRHGSGIGSSRVGCSTMQTHDYDSSLLLQDQDVFPNDDEEIDDYGEMPISSQRRGVGNDMDDLDDLII